MSKRCWPIPLLAAIAGGCDDLLTEEPEHIVTPGNFYQSAEHAEAAVLSVYPPLLVREGFGNRLWVTLEAASDMARIGPLVVGADNLVVDALAWDPESAFPTVPWGVLYLSIARANVAIASIRDIPMDEGRKAELISEAMFMRALNYYYLVRLYGEVPLMTDPDSALAEVERAAVANVYEQIVADAQEAASVLPVQRTGDDVGRPTRGSALTLLADIHLTRQQWQEAADFARRVIDLGVYSLYPDYLQAFLPGNENGTEHIFSLQADGPDNPTGSTFVAMYYPREVNRGQGGGNGQLQPTPWHYGSYIPGDYRKDVTYRTVWERLDGEIFDLDPHIYKYRPGQVTEINDGDVNWPIYRYAEVLLIYAEALNELGDVAGAIDHLNEIRARARNADGEPRLQPENYSGPMTPVAVREAIFQERNWELAHEAKRWFDLVRRGEAYFMSQIMQNDPIATDVEPTDVLFPVPQAEIDLNPSLSQNAGY